MEAAAAASSLLEYKQREHVYVAQIATLQRKLLQQKQTLSDWRNDHHVVDGQLRTAIVDPMINLEIKELRTKLFEKDQEIRKLKGELQAANFAADSTMGRRLINKCKALQEENNDLGKLLAEDRLQPLQMQIAALQKQQNVYKHHMKQLYELNKELDDENEQLSQKLAHQRHIAKYAQEDAERLRMDLDRMKAQLAPSSGAAAGALVDEGYVRPVSSSPTDERFEPPPVVVESPHHKPSPPVVVAPPEASPSIRPSLEGAAGDGFVNPTTAAPGGESDDERLSGVVDAAGKQQ